MNPSQAIQALIGSGMTEQVIAAAAGINQSTVNRIRNGAAPRWEIGHALVQMALAIDAPKLKKKKAA